MALDMTNTSIGVSREGMVQVKESIKIGLINESINSINTNVEQLNSNISNYWHGAAANAFEMKVNSEKSKVITILKVLEAKMELDLGVMATNSAIADAEVAAALGGSVIGGGSGQGGNNNTRHPADNQGTTEPGGVYPQSLVEDPTSTPERDNTEAQNINVDNEVPEYKDTWYENLWLGIQKTDATLATAGTSILEGLGLFGEGLGDTSAIIGAGIATYGTGVYDAANYLYSQATGKDFHSVTADMWDGTMAYVADENCKWMFDSFYNDTAVGQTLKRYCYGFDTTRGVSNGIGYTTGVVALSIGTAGVATGAVSGGGAHAAAYASAMQSSLPTTMGAIGATAGFGKGTQEAWSHGASLSEGLTYGGANAAWEGAQFYLGGKINSVAPFQNAAGNAALRVGLDMVDSGAEGIVQPKLQTIYSDKSFNELFQEAGGWNNVASQAAMGGALSALGEAGGLAKALRGNSTVADSVEALPTNTDELTNIVDSPAHIENEIKDVVNTVVDTANDSKPLSSINGFTVLADRQMDENNTVRSIGNFFGDAGSEVNELMREQHMTINEILDKYQSEGNILEYDKLKEFVESTHQGQFLQSLTTDEIRSINGYTSSEYQPINRFLGENKTDLSGATQSVADHIRYIDAAMDKYGGLDEDMVLYRAVSSRDFRNTPFASLFGRRIDDNPNELYAALKAMEGTSLEKFGYLSASPGFNTSFASDRIHNIIFEIQAEKGTRGAYINQLSIFYNEECEYLIGRGHNLIFNNVRMLEGTNKVIVNCSLVDLFGGAE